MKDQEPDSNGFQTKCGKKSQGLYNLLVKKKRIGCLQVEKNASFETDDARESDNGGKILGAVAEPKDNCDSINPNAKTSKSDTSTNVALCCAITESSRTPLHRRLNSKETELINRKNILQRMSAVKSSDCEKNQVNMLCDIPKPNSVADLASHFDSQRKLCLEKNRKTHKRSISLSKNALAPLEKSEREKYSDEKSLVSTPSADDSPDSSPSPVSMHMSVRRKFLLKQRSVDNIVASSPGLSPVSTRSVPGSETGKKKKSRPASVILAGGKKIESADRNRAPSMDSLARHSLLAAQVLHLIPANKARERNFLHGRIAANSLLGSVELEKVLPSREVRIYVATWNMNGQAPPQGLNPLLLPDGLEHVPDIVAVGTQESYPERFQWEVTLQETLGPSHVLFHSVAFGTLHLAIFIRRDLIWFSSVAEESSFSVRPGTAFRTKGALGVGFYLFGTSFLFITCHLTAHQDKVKERLNDIRKITKCLELPKTLPTNRHRSKDVTDNFDYVLWCGDLNFRLSRPRSEVLNWVSQQSFPLVDPPEYIPEDQLTSSLNSGNVLRGFEEAPITFAPTYKYDPGTQNFDSSQKQRTPSYTDRILFKSRRGGLEALQCLEYSSVPTVCTSDHKPVWGLYKCPIRPGIDTIPLAAGLFNREVYLEAIKRRAAAMDQRDDSSTVCSIQ